MVKSLNKMISAGLVSAVINLFQEFKIFIIHRVSLIKINKYVKKCAWDINLNIGCGSNLKVNWINIDLHKKADLRLDIREPLPFETCSVAQIYSEHFFEHLEYPRQALSFLAESLRALRPGGLFSVVVPDTEWPLRSYVNQEEEYFEIARKFWHPDWCNTRMHCINYHFRQDGEHKYAYDFETLAHILRDIGFESIQQRSFDQKLDDASRRIGSLYIDAYKPNNN